MTGLGLKARHDRTCQQCGTVFVAAKASSRYCSVACRKAGSRFGKSWGNTEPRPMKVYRR